MECIECGRAFDARARPGRPRRYCSRSCQGRAYRRRRDRGRLSAPVAGAQVDPRLTTALEAAIAIADTDGVGAVTLGSVAHRAGLPVAAALREFGSRDRLVATMVQHVVARRRGVGPEPQGPLDVLSRLAEDEWRSYRTHPWLVGVMASTRPPLEPAVLDASRAAVKAFMALGLDSGSALNRYLAFNAYIQGMGSLLVTEHQDTMRSGTSYRNWWTREVRRLDRTGAMFRHPWLGELTEDPPAEAFDADAVFRDGLHRVIRGLTTMP